MKSTRNLGLRILAIVLVFIMFLIPSVYSWWDLDWEYRQPINVSSSLGTTQADFQIEILLNSSNVGANFSWLDTCEDVRFIDNDDQTALDYWIESCSIVDQNASIWIKIPDNISITNREIFMYYSNSAVSNISNGTSTFDFFDDFESGLGKWTEHKNAVDIFTNSGYLETGGGTTSSPYGHTVIGSDATYDEFVDGIIEGRVYLSSDAIAEVGSRGIFSTNEGYKSRMDARSGEGVSHLEPPYNDGSWGFLSSCSPVGGAVTTLTWLNFIVTVVGTSLTIEADSNSITCTDSIYSGPGEISLQNHYGSYTRWDDIRVRKYFANSINTNIGSEQSVPSTDNVAQIFSSTLGQDGDLSTISINFDNQTVVMDKYSHSTSVLNSRLEFNEPGLYKLHYTCTWESTGANGRHIMENFLRLNGATTITPSLSSCYIREQNLGGNQCSNSGTTLVSISNASDYVELMGYKLQGSSGSTITSDDCHLYAQEIQGSVAQIYDDTGAESIRTPLRHTVANSTFIDLSEYTRINDTALIVSSSTWHRLSYTTCFEQLTDLGGSNSRQSPQTRVLVNGQNMYPSTSTSYTREDGIGDRNCNQATLLLNLTSGDNIQIESSLKSNQTSEDIETLANQSWFVIEKINENETAKFSEIGSGDPVINISSPITFDNIILDNSFVSFTEGSSLINFDLGGFYEISYNFGWDDSESGGRRIACVELRLNGNEKIRPSISCDYSRGTSDSGFSSVSSTILLNVSSGDYVELLANATSPVSVEGNETWIVIEKIAEEPQFIWSESLFDLGINNVNEGDLSEIVDFTVYRDQTGIELNCISGDCLIFTENFTNGVSLSSGNIPEVSFTCLDNTVGDFSALFELTSDQKPIGSVINVTCQIFSPTGHLEIDILDPPNSGRRVGQNRTFSIEVNVSCIGNSSLTCGNVSSVSRFQSVYGTGLDGDITINSLETVVNNYTYLIDNELAGDNLIVVNDTSEFFEGDEILIIQMQNGTGIGSAGIYEFAMIESISSENITLVETLKNSYGSGVFNNPLSSVSQIVRVPQYTTVTVNSGASIVAKPWDGYSGGIVIFRSTLSLNTSGYINVSNQGFRGGGCGGCGNDDWGLQGESTIGVGSATLSANGIGGGGGYGPTGLGGEPGGGGGHATSGGDGIGAFTSNGGSSIGYSNLSRIFFGGGAGAGGDNDDITPFPEFVSGGGIAMIFADTINDGRILAQGEQGFSPGGAGGTTGGGAGGSIWLTSENMSLVDVNALGGLGGISGGDNGGDGGLGRIRLDYSIFFGSTSPASAFNGSSSESVFNEISTNFAEIPFWTSSSQPQSCILDGGESCILTWAVNATGALETSYFVDVQSMSNLTIIPRNTSLARQVNITSILSPTVTLLSPVTGSKLFGNGTIEFVWEVADDSSLLNCTIFLGSTQFVNTTCSGSGNNVLNLTVPSGTYNWYVQALDEDNFTGTSSPFIFTNILNISQRFTKLITYENSDQYLVRLIINNLANFIFEYTALDFVNILFNAGSFTPLFDFVNITPGEDPLNGRIYGWIINDTGEVNYSITGIDDYNLTNNYVIVG